MKINRLKESWETETLGVCVTLQGVEGHVVAVQVPPDKDALFTIMHESVHVWQGMMEYIQESEPGIETEAYTIENIAKQLMLEYQRLTGESLAVHDKRKARLQKREQAVQQPS